eukprot:TRINITY_DN10338_c0_g2_i1.p2 TRINITY_DN10338_c0_g2~~TRINITY_DN10338_c0_g2_i1.p2  ORF type:complete len:322 (+),score=143.29 TRINITY_DN10338_c0_g2_i1:44-967(+)
MRPNEIPLVDEYGEVDYQLAAIRIQCLYRKKVAKRAVNNVRLKQWYLNRNARRIQVGWRMYSSRKELRVRREANVKKLAEILLQNQERALHELQESFLWRMTVCEEKAAIIQRWFRKYLDVAKARGRGVTDQLRVETFDPRALQAYGKVEKAKKELEELKEHHMTLSVFPHKIPLPETPIPDGEDLVPSGAVLRGPIRAPPSTGIRNINVRKEEREKKELRGLELTIFITHATQRDRRNNAAMEQAQIEADSATRIQSLFRGKQVRDLICHTPSKPPTQPPGTPNNAYRRPQHHSPSPAAPPIEVQG